MRKNLLVFTIAVFFTFQSRGQYASAWAGYPAAYELSSGFATHASPGYFWLGYLSSVQNISTTWHVNKNFCIMGTGSSGIYSAYKVFESNACTGSLTQVLNGYGVSAIETSGQNNLGYALAGAYDQACYFTTLDHSGNVLSAMSYPFPYTPTGLFPAPTKPIIVEADMPGHYFICGYFESRMYVIKVNVNGAILWSSFYNMGTNLMPKDIMMNPYNSGELIIVGETSLLMLDTQGFFMKVDGTDGSVIQVKKYGDFLADDGFASITKGANCNQGNGHGFVIGGYTHLSGGSPASNPWLLKLNPAGNIIWSRELIASTGGNTGIIDVVERLNTFNEYEYYALLNSTVGMQVLKLDDTGSPFPYSSPNALHNEFIYDLPSSAPSRASSISYVNTQAPTVDVGIQVYGTASNFAGLSSSYMVSAYFNGETNCYRTLTRMLGSVNGPMWVSSGLIFRSGSFSACSNFQVQAFFPGGTLNYPCFGLMSSGSNQRSLASGMSPQEDNTEDFSIFPNPVMNKTQVNYSVQDNSEIHIALYNLLGQCLLNIQPDPGPAGTYQEELDLSALNVEKGVYLVITTVDGVAHKQKIVYTK